MLHIRALLMGALLLCVPDGTFVARYEPFPPLPEAIPSALGWVKVERPTPPLKCGDVDAIGCWTYSPRKLEVISGLSPERAWFVLEHERVHMILADANLTLADATQENRIADAIATNRVVLRLLGQ